jgi:CDP-paratose synthetase
VKIIVSGATGFIGSNLVPRMLTEGLDVAALVRKGAKLEALSGSLDRIQLYNCDTYQNIERAITSYSPDVVIHLAAYYVNNHSHKDIDELIDSNIKLGTNILEAMANAEVARLLTVGTRWQHLDDYEYNPANLYSATKEAFKNILSFYQKRGIRHKTLELCDTFGERDTRGKIVELLVKAGIEGKDLRLSPGNQVLDISYVGDVCSHICTCIQSDEYFNNTTDSLSGTEICLKDLGSMIESVIGNGGHYLWNAMPYRGNEVMCPPAYYTKVFIARQSLESRLKDYILYTKARRETR